MRFTAFISAVALLAHSANAIKPSTSLVHTVSTPSQSQSSNSTELWSSGTSISPPFLVKSVSMSAKPYQEAAQKPFVATEARSETSQVPSPASSTVSLATSSAESLTVPAADIEAETEQVTAKATGSSAEASAAASSSSPTGSRSAVSTAGANDEYRKQAMAPMAAAAIALVGAVAAL